MFAIIARLRFKAGYVDEGIRLLSQAATLSRQEPGCHMYIANQDLADPDTIVMYEQYDDESAFLAHRDSAHFAEIVARKVLPLLESRTRETFTVVSPA